MTDPGRDPARPTAAGTDLGRPTSVSVFAARVHAFDRDRRPIVAGFLFAVTLAIAMAAKLDATLPVLGWLVATAALFAPSAGLTVIATLAMLREPAGLGPIGFNGTVIAASGLGMLGRLVLDGLVGRRIAIRPEFAAIGAFLVLSTFQFLRLAARTTDERERFALTQLIAVCSGLILVIVIGTVFSSTSRRWVVTAMVPGIILAAFAAMASLSPAVLGALPIGGLLPTEDISVRGTGIFRNPNYLGLAMALGFVLVGRSRSLELPTGMVRRPWLLAGPVAIAVIVSFSRGALLALVGGIVALYASRGRRALALASIVGLLAVAIGYPVLLNVRHALTFGPNVELGDEAQAASDASRVAVLEAGIKLLARQPIMGIGVGQFHYESVTYVAGSPVTYPHNTYLQIAVEQGLLGISAFMLVLVTLFYSLSRARGDPYRVTARSMLVIFSVGALFAEPLTSMQGNAILWIAIGAALAGAEPSGHPDSFDVARGRFDHESTGQHRPVFGRRAR